MVGLASPEALAGLECSFFWISAVDVRDAFHRMALPDDLSDFFALPRGTAREFSVCELNGEPLGGAKYLCHGFQLGQFSRRQRRRWLRPLESQKASFSTTVT